MIRDHSFKTIFAPYLASYLIAKRASYSVTSLTAKQQGATPLRRKALGDITNSRASGPKQNTPSSKQSGGKGAKVESKAAVAQPAHVHHAHSEEIEVATRFAAEESYVDPAFDEGLDALLNAAVCGPLCVCMCVCM